MNNFGKLIKAKTISFNDMLIRHYHSLMLNETEAMIIMLLYINAEENDHILSSGMLKNKSTLQEDQVSNLLLKLVQRGIIDLDIDQTGKEFYSLDPIINQLGNVLEGREEISKKPNQIGELVSYIETAYGRLISPSDLTIVNGWLDEGYSEMAIKDAIFESMKVKKMHLKYADAILVNRNKVTSTTTVQDKSIQALLQGVYVKKK